MAILGFSNMQPTSFYAGEDRAGVNPASLNHIKEDVAAAHARADLVIVLFHFGEELSSTPTARQRLFAHTAVDAGADLVIGHRPHVLQGLERYHGALIAYSLGNFVFPSHRPETRQPPSSPSPATQPAAPKPRLIPCLINGVKPFIAKPKERTAILARVRQLSQNLGTHLDENGAIAW